MGIFKDLSGKRFGKILVESPSHLSNRKGYYWNCICDCGAKKVILGAKLSAGENKSCGCSRNEHIGEANTKHGYSSAHQDKWVRKLYANYNKIKDRCYNPQEKSYGRYGGKGRKMCAGWLNSVESFINDVGEKPSSEHTIDRANNDLHYSCGHCDECIREGWHMNVRWATQGEQQRNRSDNYWVVYNGNRMVLADLCNELNVPRMQLKYWLGKGLNLNDAVSKTINRTRKRRKI